MLFRIIDSTNTLELFETRIIVGFFGELVHKTTISSVTSTALSDQQFQSIMLQICFLME